MCGVRIGHQLPGIDAKELLSLVPAASSPGGRPCSRPDPSPSRTTIILASPISTCKPQPGKSGKSGANLRIAGREARAPGTCQPRIPGGNRPGLIYERPGHNVSASEIFTDIRGARRQGESARGVDGKQGGRCGR